MSEYATVSCCESTTESHGPSTPLKVAYRLVVHALYFVEAFDLLQEHGFQLFTPVNAGPVCKRRDGNGI